MTCFVAKSIPEDSRAMRRSFHGAWWINRMAWHKNPCSEHIRWRPPRKLGETDPEQPSCLIGKFFVLCLVGFGPLCRHCLNPNHHHQRRLRYYTVFMSPPSCWWTINMACQTLFSHCKWFLTHQNSSRNNTHFPQSVFMLLIFSHDILTIYCSKYF